MNEESETNVEHTPQVPSVDRLETSPPATTDPQPVRLVKIKFRSAGRHYDFNAVNFTLTLGDRVIVETDRGRALGMVVSQPRQVSAGELPEGLKNIMRHATAEDLAMATNYATREYEALRFCRDRSNERKMEMKLVRAEYLFDGSKIIFYFTADGRIDFRELVKDLAHHFHTRIEMRQIGVRDEAKLTGGIGICGRELCCCTYLNEFAPVSVKMAKEQGLALNPSKISGQCGRLLCCLAYEFETYCDLKKSLPKCGRKIVIEGREGEVIEQHLLRQTVTVAFGHDQKIIMTAEEVEKGIMPQQGAHLTSPTPTAADRAPHHGRGNREQHPERHRAKPQALPKEKEPAVQPAPPPTRQQGTKPQQQLRQAQEPRTVLQQPKQAAQTEAAGASEKRRKRRRRNRKPQTANKPESGE